MISRYVAVLHFTWLVNSAAHMFGMKPYDKNIGPAENRSNPLLKFCSSLRNWSKTHSLKTITCIETILQSLNPTD